MNRSPVLVSLSLILLMGCSGGDNALTPPLTEVPETTSQEDGSGKDQPNPQEFARFFQYVEMEVDTAHGTVTVLPMRADRMHLNLVEFPNLAMGVSAEIVEFIPPDHIVLDISLTHPLENPNLTAFDIKGALIEPATLKIGIHTLSGPGDTTLENADGFTRWWNPIEFPVPGYFGYTDGNIGMKNNFLYNATLHPYKAFADALEADDTLSMLTSYPVDHDKGRAVFSAGTTNTRRYEIRFALVGGAPVIKFNYVIDVSWKPPSVSPPEEIPDDFPIGANQDEAYIVEVADLENGLKYSEICGPGGELEVVLRVQDWQGQVEGSIADQIGAVRCYAPDIFPNPIELELLYDSNQYAKYILSTDNGYIFDSAGDKPMLFEVECAGSTSYKQNTFPAPNDPVAAYQLTFLQIEHTDLDPVNEVEPNETMEDATFLDNCQMGVGSLDGSTDPVDTWKFTVGDASKVTCRMNVTGDPADGTFSILNSSGMPVDFITGTLVGEQSIGPIYLQPDDYYMRLVLQSSTMDYEVWVEREPVGELSESEPNNIIDEADYFPGLQNGTGILCTGLDDMDIWKWSLSQPSRVDYNWFIQDGQISGEANLVTYDDQTIHSTHTPVGQLFTISPAFLPQGTWYTKLEQHEGSCLYETWFDAEPLELDEIEPNNDWSTSTSLELDQPSSGILTAYADNKDFWTFTLTESGAISITCTLIEGVVPLELSLLDQYGAMITKETSAPGGVFQIDLDPFPEGIYHVAIEQVAGSCLYEMNVDFTGVGEFDESEPNDLPEQADPLELGQWVTGMLLSPVDKYDYWTFSLDSPAEISISWHITSGTASGQITLKAVNGTTISYTYTPVDDYFTIGPIMIGEGDYLIQLFQANDWCEYELMADGIFYETDETEPNNSWGTADPLEVGVPANGFMMDTVDEGDYWTFNLDSPSEVTASYQAVMGEIYGQFELLGETGGFIAETDIAAGVAHKIENIYLPAGIYILRLSEYQGWVLYDVSVETEPAPVVDEVEPNNSILEANPLPLGEYKTGTLTNNIDKFDYWAFTLDNPSSITATMHILDGSEDTEIRIEHPVLGVFSGAYDPDNGYLVTGPDFVPPGDYYLKLTSNDVSCLYEVRVDATEVGPFDEVEPNNSIPEANPLSEDFHSTGMLTQVIDRYDYREITIDSKTVLTAWAQLISGSTIPEMALYDSSGIQLAGGFPDDGKKQSGPLTLDPGLYYLSVYTINTSCLYETWYETTDAVWIDEIEPNDDISTATPLDVGEHGMGNTQGLMADPEDFWKFILPEPTKIDVWCTYWDDAPYSLRLYNETGVTITYDNQGYNGYSITSMYLPSGTYYLKMHTVIGNTDYELWIDREILDFLDETEPNNDFSDADFLSPFTHTYGILTNLIDPEDYWTFNIASPSIVDIYLQLENQYQPAYFVLYDDSESWISSCSDSGNGLLAIENWILAPGTYYVWIDWINESNMYDLWYEPVEIPGITEIEPNDTTDDANPTTIGTHEFGILALPVDLRDYYTFTLDNPDYLTIWWRILDGLPHGKLTLLNDLSEELYSDDTEYDGEYWIVTDELPAGTYFIGLRQNDDCSSYEMWVEYQ